MGGALYLNVPNFSINNNIFNKNIANYRGGAIFVDFNSFANQIIY